MASTIWALLVSRLPVKVSIWESTERTLSSRPVTALLSSWVIVFSWATPPPLRIRLSAPSTSSTSGFRGVVRSSGMTSPLPSGLSLAPASGGERETNFSPSRLVWRIFGERVVGQLRVVAQLDGDLGGVAVGFIFFTLPTLTSLTLTVDFGTRSRTSWNITVTVIGSLPTSMPRAAAARRRRSRSPRGPRCRAAGPGGSARGGRSGSLRAPSPRPRR